MQHNNPEDFKKLEKRKTEALGNEDIVKKAKLEAQENAEPGPEESEEEIKCESVEKTNEVKETSPARKKIIKQGQEETVKNVFFAISEMSARQISVLPFDSEGQAPVSNEPCKVYHLNNQYLVNIKLLGSKKLMGGEERDVFLCEDMETNKLYILKAYSDLTNKTGKPILKSIENEVNILKKCNLFVSESDFIATEGNYYVVEECVPGKNLLTIFEEHHKDSTEFSFDKKIEIAIKIVEKLEQLHKMGILHRDIKLENIMFDGENVFFIDFELSLAADETLEAMTPDCFFTPGLIPPELISSATDTGYLYSDKTDIFLLSHTLGALLGVADQLSESLRAKNSMFKTKLEPGQEMITSLLKQGVSTNPKARPSLAEISATLKILKSEYDAKKENTSFKISV